MQHAFSQHDTNMDERARTLTTALCQRIEPFGADVGMVLQVYEWVRETVGIADPADIDNLARRWQEQQRSPDDWMMRAFGD